MTISRRAPRKSGVTRREEVVRAMLHLLAQGGHTAASTSAIARRVGLTQSALFKHFADKEALWRAVLDVIGIEVGARLAAAGAAPGGARVRVRCLIEAYLRAMLEIPAMPALLFMAGEGAADAGPGLRAEISRRFGWLHAAIVEQLDAGQQSGELCTDFDPDVAATMAVGFAHGLILRWRLGGQRLDLLKESRRGLDLLLRGLRSGAPRARLRCRGG